MTAVPQSSSVPMLMKTSRLCQGHNDLALWEYNDASQMVSSRTQKWTLRKKRKGQVTYAESLFIYFCVPTSLTAEHQKPFWVLWDRADKCLMTSLANIICTTSWFPYSDSTKKVWTSTASMFKIYLPHAEDGKCTIKDHLENYGNGYGKHKLTAFTVLTPILTVLILMQLQAANKGCKNKIPIWKMQFCVKTIWTKLIWNTLMFNQILPFTLSKVKSGILIRRF